MCKFVNWADNDGDDVEIIRPVPSSYASSYSSKFPQGKTFLVKTRPLPIVAESPGYHSNWCGAHPVDVYDFHCDPTYSNRGEYQSPFPPVIFNNNNFDLQNPRDGYRSADTDIIRVRHWISRCSTHSGGGLVGLQKPSQSRAMYSRRDRGTLPVVRHISRGGHGRSVRFEDEV